MNIVYAVKIFLALCTMLAITRVVAGPGLRAVLDAKDFRNVWLGIVGTLVVSCFSARVELFFVVLPIWVLILSNMLGKDGSGRLPTYALLCCICPPILLPLRHVGPLNDIILLTPFRILALFVLLPEALRLMGRVRTGKTPSWLLLCDLVTATYAVYWFGRHLGAIAISSVGRELVGQILDTLLPYYVLTRACIQAEVRQRFLAFALVGAVYQAFVGVAESLSGHYLYSQLQWLYHGGFVQSGVLMRGSWLRAEAAFPGPLAMAVLMLFGIGVWFALKKPEKDRRYLVSVIALVGALLATYGRGPIIAGLVFFLGVALLRRMSRTRYLTVMIASAIVLGVSWQFGVGDLVTNAISSLSGSDTTADFNVRYRQELLTTSLALIHQSPWFGVPNYLAQMQDLRQGEGIIDLVNTYLVVALNSGLFGIALVFTPFAVTLWRTATQPQPGDGSEASAWLALTIAVMVAIFTVSPISIIQPIMVWLVALALARLQQPAAVAVVRPVTPPERSYEQPPFADAWR